MVKRKKIRCASCGKKFTPYHLVNQDYCCNACRQAGFRKKFEEEHGMSPARYQRMVAKKKAKKRKGVKV